MGSYVPRIVSPITGQPEAAPSTGFVFEPTEENLGRWRIWWKFANREQLSTFVLITFLSIVFMSLLAYSTVYGRPDLPDDIGFLQVEGEVLAATVGAWFGVFFWFIGAFSLFAAALGIVDYTSRLAADVIKTSYLHDAKESTIYFVLVWGLVLIGCAILLAGFDQPIVLLVISACVGGTDDGDLLSAADHAQPQGPARADQDRGRSACGARLCGPALRRAGRDHDHRPGR